MSVLEEKIKKNKESFDVHEPSAGHFDRFSEKLGYSRTLQRKRMVFGIAWKVAAVFVIVFAISFLLPDQPYNTGRELASQVMTDENYEQELQNIKKYYGFQKEKKLEKIQQMSCENPDCAELKQFATEEIDQLERSTRQLEEDFESSGQNSRLFHALVNNYQLMSNVLDQILDKINTIEN
ncbi:MAG: hypothetical protein K9G58_09700 [Bacteroidales bacterium]|nr:hypothetical protein [Bacteroidales bacterium]MCF8398432.1 hypothetical protein [Bacteroidales bacterium]